jgi:hypothetical protein
MHHVLRPHPLLAYFGFLAAYCLFVWLLMQTNTWQLLYISATPSVEV